MYAFTLFLIKSLILYYKSMILNHLKSIQNDFFRLENSYAAIYGIWHVTWGDTTEVC